MLCPLFLLVLAKVTREGFLAPVAVTGVGDGCERGYGLVLARVLEELWMSVLASANNLDERKRTKVKAPWPPMLWPVILTLSESSCLKEEKRALGRSSVMYEYML